MFGRVVILIFVFLAVPLRAQNIDLSGEVMATNGDKICALVLASGRSMFSCNPRGPFEFTEPDNSINLQVYAAGFLPFFRNLTEFGPQTVTLTRASAGGRPVDDGVTNQDPLDGTYRLLRASLYQNDGNIYDTARDESGVTGTMVIGNNFITQTFTVNRSTGTDTFTISGDLIDFGNVIRIVESTSGFSEQLVLVERGQKVVTELNANSIGDPYSEVDHWEKVSNSTDLSSAAALYSGQMYTPYGAMVGGLLREVLRADVQRPRRLE